MTSSSEAESAEALRNQADGCRRLARTASTPAAVRVLQGLAMAYEKRAAALELMASAGDQA